MQDTYTTITLSKPHSVLSMRKKCHLGEKKLLSWRKEESFLFLLAIHKAYHVVIEGNLFDKCVSYL